MPGGEEYYSVRLLVEVLMVEAVVEVTRLFVEWVAVLVVTLLATALLTVVAALLTVVATLLARSALSALGALSTFGACSTLRTRAALTVGIAFGFRLEHTV